ncbi:Holin-like protein CidB [compost metagenome]
MQQFLFALGMILLTVAAYYATTLLYKRFSYSFLIPIVTATILIIVFLQVLHIPYNSYMIGGEWINSLLGPAVVALAYPLYKQRHFLIKHFFPILGGVLVGAISGMISVGLLAKMFGFSDPLTLSLIPKSLTTPVAIDVAKGLGGNVSMTIIAVLIAGIFGAIAAPTIFKYTRIDSHIGKGIALGSASHAIGTTKAAEYSELAFSMSSIAMTLCAIIGSFLGPIIAYLFSF